MLELLLALGAVAVIVLAGLARVALTPPLMVELAAFR